MTNLHIANPIRSLTPDQPSSIKSHRPDHIISPTDHWSRSPEAPPTNLPISFLLSPPLPVRRRPPKNATESKCDPNPTIKCHCISNSRDQPTNYLDSNDKPLNLLPSSLHTPGLSSTNKRPIHRFGCLIPNQSNQSNEPTNQIPSSNHLNYQPTMMCNHSSEINCTPRRIQKHYVFLRLLNWLQRALNTRLTNHYAPEVDSLLNQTRSPTRRTMTSGHERKSHTRSQSQPVGKSKRSKSDRLGKFQISEIGNQNQEFPNKSHHDLSSPHPFLSIQHRLKSNQTLNPSSGYPSHLHLGELSPTGCDSLNSEQSTPSNGFHYHYATAFYTPQRSQNKQPIIKPVPVKLDDGQELADSHGKINLIQPWNLHPDPNCYQCMNSSPQSTSCHVQCSSVQDVETSKPTPIYPWQNLTRTAHHHHQQQQHHHHYHHYYHDHLQQQSSSLNSLNPSKFETCPKFIYHSGQHPPPNSFHCTSYYHHHHHHHYHYQTEQHCHHHHHHYHHHHHHHHHDRDQTHDHVQDQDHQHDYPPSTKSSIDVNPSTLSPCNHYATIAELDQLIYPNQTAGRLGHESRKISSSSEHTSSSSPVITLQFINPAKDTWNHDYHQDVDQPSSDQSLTEIKSIPVDLSSQLEQESEPIPIEQPGANQSFVTPNQTCAKIMYPGLGSDQTKLADCRCLKNHILESHRKFVSDFMHLKRIGWYWGPLTVNEAELLLKDRPNGTFLVRDSSHDSYMLSVSFRAGDQTCHTRIEHLAGKFSLAALDDPRANASNSVAECIGRVMADSIQDRIRFLPTFHDNSNPATMTVQSSTVQDARRPGSLIKASLLHPLSRFLIVPSLAHLCRFELLLHVRRDHISLLPLPPALMRYLRENQYYAEIINAYTQTSHNLSDDTTDQLFHPVPDTDPNKQS